MHTHSTDASWLLWVYYAWWVCYMCTLLTQLHIHIINYLHNIIPLPLTTNWQLKWTVLGVFMYQVSSMSPFWLQFVVKLGNVCQIEYSLSLLACKSLSMVNRYLVFICSHDSILFTIYIMLSFYHPSRELASMHICSYCHTVGKSQSSLYTMSYIVYFQYEPVCPLWCP